MRNALVVAFHFAPESTSGTRTAASERLSALRRLDPPTMVRAACRLPNPGVRCRGCIRVPAEGSAEPWQQRLDARLLCTNNREKKCLF